MMIFKEHGSLRYKFWNSNFGATGYYVSTVGLNEATIRKDIREQEKEEILEEKLTKREHNNPFKGLLKWSLCQDLNEVKASVLRCG